MADVNDILRDVLDAFSQRGLAVRAESAAAGVASDPAAASRSLADAELYARLDAVRSKLAADAGQTVGTSDVASLVARLNRYLSAADARRYDPEMIADGGPALPEGTDDDQLLYWDVAAGEWQLLNKPASKGSWLLAWNEVDRLHWVVNCNGECCCDKAAEAVETYEAVPSGYPSNTLKAACFGPYTAGYDFHGVAQGGNLWVKFSDYAPASPATLTKSSTYACAWGAGSPAGTVKVEYFSAAGCDPGDKVHEETLDTVLYLAVRTEQGLNWVIAEGAQPNVLAYDENNVLLETWVSFLLFYGKVQCGDSLNPATFTLDTPPTGGLWDRWIPIGDSGSWDTSIP